MDATTAAEFVLANKGAEITLLLTDGSELIGNLISVNSKGINIKVDGKTRSVSLSRIEDTTSELDEDDELTGDEDFGYDGDEADETTDEDIYAMLEDGMSTRDLADVISDHLKIKLEPKELRVHLRALGLGVGKGRQYSLSATEFRMVTDRINAEATAS